MGPGNVGPPKKEPQVKAKAEDNSKSIWSSCEVPREVTADSTDDPRKRPECDIKYRQAVTPEDIYLQMGSKTASTASCEEMVVTVSLPGERRENVHVNVSERYLDVHSSQYRLHLALPHTVDPKQGKADWLSDTSAVQVVIRMVREFDFVNF